MGGLLDENRVVKIVAEALRNQGWCVDQELKTTEKGIDIVAHKRSRIARIEVKGETSSKPDSKRYGKCFTRSQVKHHVGIALVAAMTTKQDCMRQESIIALPYRHEHIRLVSAMIDPISCAGVRIWFVDTHCIVEMVGCRTVVAGQRFRFAVIHGKRRYCRRRRRNRRSANNKWLFTSVQRRRNSANLNEACTETKLWI